MDAAKEESYFHNKFGRYSLDEKVSMLNAAEDENLLYAVKSFQYGVDAGLYICIRYEKEEEYSLVWKLLHSLSYGGLGGKLSSGYGKFHLEEVPDEETKIFEAPLDVESSAFKYFMALSMCLPREMEMERSIEKAFFQLMKRGGFISTKENSNSNRKKQTIYMIVSGSVFRKTFEGMICDVSAGGMHPVYRYGKPLFMGIY